jgi:hypothetical protein
MIDLESEPSISLSRAPERVDALLEQLAAEYRSLPRCETLALLFREALARVGLPGGYLRRGAVARPLAQQFSVSDLERFI